MTEETGTKTIVVEAGQSGERLDKLIVGAVAGLGRAGARKLFERDKVRVNGRIASKGGVARAGDEITIVLPDVSGPGAVAEPDGPLEVRFETDLVVVAEKPAGQPTAPIEPGEKGTLANALVGHYPEMAGIGYAPREPGLVHRLDTDTSGLVLAARTQAAFETLSRALKEHRVEKSYLLLCEAEGLADSGTVEIPLAPHPKDKKRVYACIHPRDVARYAPRPASTSFRVVRRAGRWALVEAIAPVAQRHQIRAHMAAIGHPLAGDLLYGGAEIAGLRRHSLHAAFIGWAGDSTVPAFEVRSDLPRELAALLEPEPEG